MPIYGISDIRRLPRDGSIKLGELTTNEEGKTYPVQLDYFKVPEKVQAVYGPEPKELDIMFLTDDDELNFPQWLKCYGKSGLKCKGNGKTASMRVRGVFTDKDCTPYSEQCIKDGCKACATLNFILPQIPGFGVWPIKTGSWNSIVNINTCMDTIRALTGGRISFIPLKLRYDKHKATIQDPKKDKTFQKDTYILSLSINETFQAFHDKYKLPAAGEIKELASADKAVQITKEILDKKNQNQAILIESEDVTDDFIPLINQDQVNNLDRLVIRKNIDPAIVLSTYDVDSYNQLNIDQYEDALIRLNKTKGGK